MSGTGRPCGPPWVQDCNWNGSPGVSPQGPSAYVMNSRVMLVAVGVLFAVVVFIFCLHIYAKWFWRRQAQLAAAGGAEQRRRRRGLWRRRGRGRRRGHLLAQNPSAPHGVVQSRGLEKAVIEALPTFEFDGEVMKGEPLECAVCLDDFEHGEKGRTLPKCGHHFHVDCVDEWLHSHSTCPLCRAGVRVDESKPTDAASSVAATSDAHSPPQSAVNIPDAQPPIVALRRGRQRSSGSSQLPPSPTGATGLPVDPIESPVATEPQTLSSQPEEASRHETPKVDHKAPAREYETATGEIPSNVLFWGDESHMSTSQSGPSPSTIRAPSQVAIDIPQLGQTRDASTPHPASIMSPMARASASFRRLLSRGKGVVLPHDDDGVDEGGPSSNSPVLLPTLLHDLS